MILLPDPETGKKSRFPKENSVWANPFKIGKDQTREDVCKLYRDYITAKLEKEPELKSQLLELKGKTLGCWCAPESCHGHVLVELIDKFSAEVASATDVVPPKRKFTFKFKPKLKK